jgi:hypothetical protein
VIGCDEILPWTETPLFLAAETVPLHWRAG